MRCSKKIDTPDSKNADYVLSKDFIVKEGGKNIQKSGIVCPNCYKPADFVIWGVHKERLE